jgi:hypothetical protein
MTFILFWLGCAIVSAIIASSKGRSAFGWFLIGALFGIFALLLVVVLPSLKRDPNAPTPDTHVKCPDCRELVIRDARKCKHCGVSLIPQ